MLPHLTHSTATCSDHTVPVFLLFWLGPNEIGKASQLASSQCLWASGACLGHVGHGGGFHSPPGPHSVHCGNLPGADWNVNSHGGRLQRARGYYEQAWGMLVTVVAFTLPLRHRQCGNLPGAHTDHCVPWGSADCDCKQEVVITGTTCRWTLLNDYLQKRASVVTPSKTSSI